MTESLRTLAAYVAPSITRATLAQSSPVPPTTVTVDRFPAAVLFADISGFTPLTEALAQKGAEGPEELTRLLNLYFSRMIGLVEAQGGEVVKFSGDALTVLFPSVDEELGNATRRAWQTANAMQAAMAEFTTLQTSVGPVELGMKIGIGAGDVIAAQVGGFLDRWEYVIAGDPLRQIAQAEHLAQRGEIVQSPEAEAIIIPHTLPPRPLLQPDWNQVRNPAAVEAVLRVYVPGVVTTWLEGALQDWLAVLRPMSVLFIGITGIDYAQPDAFARLHIFLRVAQEIIARHDGSINKLAVDDKGTIMIGLLGAPPRAHEDDPERAVRCAMALHAMAMSMGLELAIGVTTGRVFAGPVGGHTRREYTVMGDTVNLAARLMSVAGEGQIRCDYETYHAARARLAFDLLLPVRVKGKAGLIRVYRPTGEASRESAQRTGGILIGRRAEVARLEAALNAVQAGRTRALVIEGEAGIGKSRLVEELRRLVSEQGLAGLIGRGSSIEQQTPYRAWRDIFGSYFLLEEFNDPQERQRRVRDNVLDLVPELLERLPLLNDVLGLGLPENALTASLDTHLRHESLVSLLLALLRAWASERPLVLVLEDAHWLDSLSWDLAVQVSRALTVARTPLLLVVVMRPLEIEFKQSEPQTLVEMEQTERLLLGSMSPEETLALATARLGVPEGGLPNAVGQLIRERAGGNPFFAEELVYALRDNGFITIETEAVQPRCVVSGDLQRVAQSLPDTIQGIVLSRIDRLPPEEQLTLKVAAVIGRTFGYTTLHDTLGQHMELSHRLLKTYLEDLAHLDLTPLDAPEPELTYLFKHIITQEVAYETLLFAQRRQLHRTVARWYERNFGDGLERIPGNGLESALAPMYPLLVYHWHQAEDREQERFFAGLAGRWAAAQFANVEAAGYFSRALDLTPESDLAARFELLLEREAVNDLRGERTAQAEDLAALTTLADELRDSRRQAQVALRQANYYEEAISDYGAALHAVERAIELAQETQEIAHETTGYIVWGRVLVRQGDFEAAREPLERALTGARSIHDRQAEAQSLHRLGIVFYCQEDYESALQHSQEALETYRAGGHRQGEADMLSILGMVQYELGDYPVARDYYEQALIIYRTIGDRFGETLVLNNLGTVYCDWGDFEAARDYHQQALEVRLAIGDRWGEANSLVNLGLVHHSLGDSETARRHCERALAIQRDIGDRRGEGYSLTYLGHILSALGKLQSAEETYDEAVRVRRELGQFSLLVDGWAGLAHIALARGDLDQALEHVGDILSWIEANGVGGIEYPLQVYLTCHRILKAKGREDPAFRERARSVLHTAYNSLMERVAPIRDEALRLKYLENVETNREIITLWETERSQGARPALPSDSG